MLKSRCSGGAGDVSVFQWCARGVSVEETCVTVSVVASPVCSPLSLQDIENALTLGMEEHSTLGQKGGFQRGNKVFVFFLILNFFIYGSFKKQNHIISFQNILCWPFLRLLFLRGIGIRKKGWVQPPTGLFKIHPALQVHMIMCCCLWNVCNVPQMFIICT